MAEKTQNRDTMPVTEMVGLVFALLIAIVVIGISLFSFGVDLILKFDIYGIVVDLIFLGIGIFLGYFAIRMYRKASYYESLMDTAFDRGIYERLEPVLRKVAETQVEMETVENRLGKINHMVQTVIDEQVKMGIRPGIEVEKSISPGTSIGFLAKAIILTIISMCGFIVMINTFFGSYPGYITLAFFVLWWLLISSEFKVFDKNTARVALFLPIILVPVSVIILWKFGIFALNNILGIFYACLALYAFLYYSWAVYETKGTLPFNLDFLRHIKRK